MKLQDKSNYLIFVIFLLLLINEKSVCQSYFIRNYSIESGLPTSFVSDVTQDAKGRMWFTTATGISIYDGFQWENLNVTKRLPGSRYRKIKTDEKGIIWCLPDYMCESIVYFENDSMKTIALPEIRKENDNLNISSFGIIYENNNPSVCIGTYNGIYLFKNGLWKKFVKNDGLLDEFIYSITEYQNKFYISTKGGLSVFDGNNFDNNLNNLLTAIYSDVLAVAFDKDVINSGKMWILGKGWIGYIEDNRFKVFNDKFLLPTGIEFEFPSLVLGRNNLIFFGNFYNTFYINKITNELYPLTHKQGFKSDGSTSIFIDKEENLWKTGTRGVDKLSSLCLVNYDETNGLLEDEVTAILEYQQGKFVIGHNEGVTLLNDNKTVKIYFPASKSGYSGDYRVMDVCKGKGGTIWLACASGGLGKLDKSGKIKWIKLKKNNYASSVASDSKGNIYITCNDGVFVVKDDVLVESSKYNIKKQFYRRMFIIDDNEAYFASSNGIAYKKNDEIKFILSNDYKANNVYAILKDKNNNVLVGTKGGLYILKNDSILKFNENGFEINKSVYAILRDNSGNYWFGTDDGVIKWDGIKKEKSFSKGNGLSGIEINRAAFYKDSKDNIWIGTESGMTCYRPEFDNNFIPVPEVIFYNTEDAEGYKYSMTSNSNLNSNIKSLFFNFRGISFYSENNIKYKIKLVGFDADWYEVSQSHIDKIRYTNLIPGDYKLLVSAKNVSGEWSKVVESSVITIEKPFYQKWWFFILILIVVYVLLHLLYKLYIGRMYYIKLEKQVLERTSKLLETEKELRKSQSQLEEKVIERTSELAEVNEQLKELNASKDKFFSIIAHDMKSPFTGLLGYSELLKNEASEMDKKKIIEYSENLYKNLKNTYNLLENLLNWASLQTGRMTFNPEKVDLFLLVQGIIDLLKVNSNTKNIALKNKVAINTTVRADKNMLRTVIYNIVSNSIKFTNRGGEVVISSKRTNGFVEIFVSDNGVGIPENSLNLLFKLASNVTTKGTEMERGTGLGLLLCKEMIDKHNGKISVESVEGKGTTFRITLADELL